MRRARRPALCSSASSASADLVAGLADRAALGRRAARRSRAGSWSARPCGPGSGPAAPPAPRSRTPPRSSRPPPSLSARSARSQPSPSSPPTSGAIFAPGGDDIRCRAIAAAAATFSDSAPGRSGIVTRRSHCASTSSGSPSRSAPRPGSPASPSASSGSPPCSDQRRARRRGRLDPGAQQRLAEDRAHARPHRARPVGIGAVGADHHRAADQRGGGADDGADVAGVRDAVQVDAGRRGLARPSAGARSRSPACPSPAPRRCRAAPARPRCRRGPRRRRSAARPARRPPARAAASRSSPSPRTGRRPRASAAAGSLRTSFSFSLCGLVITSSRSGSETLRNEKGGRCADRPGNACLGAVGSGRGTLPG